MVLNFGPQHPATHGTLRIVLELDGERIVRADPEIGFLHTGFEKLGEYMNFNKYVTVTDRMNYLSPLSNNIGFVLAVEDYLGIALPPAGRHFRVALAELSRIADHILCTGLQAMDLGAFTVFLWCFRERERLYDLFEYTTGARLTTSFTRIGGMARGIPEDFDKRVSGFLETFPETLADVEGMLSKNRIWHKRTRGIGVLPKEDAVAHGVTGPILRASGVPYDLRRVRPYLTYGEMDFDVPTESDGDAYARYRVRMAEMRQSANIVRQALEQLKKLRGEPVNVQDPSVILPDKDRVYSQMESMIYHFKLIMPGHGIRPPIGEHYHATEAPNGELGFYLVYNGEDRPYRCRVRSPSFNNYCALPLMVEGQRVSDLVSTLGSLNVIAGELDR
jgi:NADH dehydrogenase I D subunit